MIEERIIDEMLRAAPVLLLIAVRALAMIETAPLLSSDAVPQVAKIALAGFAAFAVLPSGVPQDSSLPVVRGWVLNGGGDAFDLRFVFLLIGEAFIGIIIGFFLNLIFAAFSTAGQFFSLQMGFGASETFDPLSQIENPLMGQYLNLAAMLVFLSVDGFQQLFLMGFQRSIQSISVISLVEGRETVTAMVAAGLSRLFMDAIIIAMPILGTLFLTSLSTGLISKAAPQINILSEGFPISITVAFMLIFATLPFMMEAFSRVVDTAFTTIENLYIQIGGQVGAAGIKAGGIV
ncbi:MAG: flagellar biosynthetic protein FliR [Treponema sp.]|nr:flagellar biosynthetic protein FliR [Treponema sp.]